MKESPQHSYLYHFNLYIAQGCEAGVAKTIEYKV